MRGTGRHSTAGMVAAALAVGVLAGCSSGAESGAGAATATPAAKKSAAKKSGVKKSGVKKSEAKAAPKGRSLGGSGTACVMPVSFDLAPDWKPKAITVSGPDDPLADLTEQGTVKTVCEIDAKPTGYVGFMRVWTGEPGATPRKTLEAFVAEERKASKITYSEIKAGALPAVEVRYTTESALWDEPQQEQAFAVAAPDGVVIVQLGGLDNQESAGMLPGYELARKTVRAS
ncbi:lipoprotein [Streptomyces sp. H27-C3]|uniref:lipoprotein n=1 Tax=Streptomyces sp. H27-C3 TaxID=3046305 RepID=UPI0024BA14C0|nr:lipoprotein [Streptomyces sp. H27-C3]MDJ0466380.1 lipoprotein [Streptomyces sp. H27-C3]